MFARKRHDTVALHSITAILVEKPLGSTRLKNENSTRPHPNHTVPIRRFRPRATRGASRNTRSQPNEREPAPPAERII